MTPDELDTLSLINTLKPLAILFDSYRHHFVNADLLPDNILIDLLRPHINGRMIREMIQFVEKNKIKEKQQ